MDSALVGTGLHSPITRKFRKGYLVFCLHHLLQLLGAFSSGDHASLISQSRNAFHKLGFKFEAVVWIANTVRSQVAF
jgi:hypothetical protein